MEHKNDDLARSDQSGEVTSDLRADHQGESNQCKQTVQVRDTYRYIGGKSHFKRHYTKRRCKRRAVHGDVNGFCTQHARCAW